MIFTFIVLLAIPLVFGREEVCDPCDKAIGDTDCFQDEEYALEVCVDLGDGHDRCYWANDSVVELADGQSRKCINDGSCWGINDENIHFIGNCLRCCEHDEYEFDLCTETISTGSERCGPSPPCCPGEICLYPDSNVGLCGVEAAVCETCNDGNAICGEGLQCITDDSPGMTHLYSRDEFQVTLTIGMCVPSEDAEPASCSVDADCDGGCLRCCDGKCIRVRGDAESFCGEMGPCCCAEDECCDNECVPPTPFPSNAPVIKPTDKPADKVTIKPTDKPTDKPAPRPAKRHSGDNGGNGGNGEDESGSDEQDMSLFAGLIGDEAKEEDSGNGHSSNVNNMELTLSSSVLWTMMALIIFIAFCVALTVWFCRSGPPKARRVSSESIQSTV